jgi:ribonuclease D
MENKKGASAASAPAEGVGPAGRKAAHESTSRRLRIARTRFRQSSHELAHEEEHHAGEHASDNPLVPGGKGQFISAAEQMTVLIEELRRPRPECGGQRIFAYDSEFIGESTYRPRLCLIQVATPQTITFVDPMSGLDLAPFWQLFSDASIRKIVHAGEQDLEPVVRAGVEPANVIDTQVIAGFCALPYPTSLAKLVEHVLGVRLGKGLTFTQWDQRPLSKKQLSYAADDVRFLLALATGLIARLEQAGLSGWAEEECLRRARLAARNDAQEPWKKVRGIGGMGSQQLAIIRELATWREQAAQNLDLPPRAVLRDEVLVDLARHPPKAIEQLARQKYMPRPLVEQFGHEMLAAVEAGRTAAPIPPGARAPEPTLAEKFAADSALALLQTIALGRGIDPTLLANRRDVESFARLAAHGAALDSHLLMQGWRREAAGELMRRLISSGGKAKLEWLDGRPILTET